MKRKILRLLNKHRDIFVYLIFGVLTTLVNYLIYFPLFNLAGLSGALSNVIAWAGAVVFAYCTNKPFVYKSTDWSANVVFPEFGKFVGYRFGSGLLETCSIWLFVDMLHFNGNGIKLLAAAFVVVFNYITGKLLFRSQK